jgi:hypothetical protein
MHSNRKKPHKKRKPPEIATTGKTMNAVTEDETKTILL